ncbi:MAG: 3-keto-5-aminohexanoate cleavage protein [Opitutaceae bacterium]
MHYADLASFPSLEELARDISDRAAAGASVVHFHVTEATGRSTSDTRFFDEVVRRVHERCDLVEHPHFVEPAPRDVSIRRQQRDVFHQLHVAAALPAKSLGFRCRDAGASDRAADAHRGRPRRASNLMSSFTPMPL